jgi:hypothetical protein
VAAEAGVEREFFTSQRRRQPYTAGVMVPVAAIAPGATRRVTVPLYIGPQETDKLEKVAPGLELVVDYGWLYILAAPLFWLLKWIHGFVGNWGWSIVILTILIKLVFYPLNAKAGRSMAQMKVLGPKMEKLKQLYGDDRQKLNQAMMELYKHREDQPARRLPADPGADPGVHRALLGAARVDRAAPRAVDRLDPGPLRARSVLHPPVMLRDLDVRHHEAEPAAGRPGAGRIMLCMPIMFSVFFLFFPAGLVLYWVVQNLLVDRAAVASSTARSYRGEAKSPALNAGGETIAAVATRGAGRHRRRARLRRARARRSRTIGASPRGAHAHLARFRRDGAIDAASRFLSRAAIRTPARTCSSCRATAARRDAAAAARCSSWARVARAGEFTRRAFLNERIDLAQAESVADLSMPRAPSGAQRGSLARWRVLRAHPPSRRRLIALRVHVEAVHRLPRGGDRSRRPRLAARADRESPRTISRG